MAANDAGSPDSNPPNPSGPNYPPCEIWRGILAELHRIIETLVRHPTRQRDRLFAFCVPREGDPLFFPSPPDAAAMGQFEPMRQAAIDHMQASADLNERIEALERVFIPLRVVPQVQYWLGQLIGTALPYGEGECVAGWLGWLPDIDVGLSAEWEWASWSHNPLFPNHGVLPNCLTAYRNGLAREALLPDRQSLFSLQPTLAADRAARIGGSIIEGCVIEGILRQMRDAVMGRDQPLLAIVQRFQRLAQLTMEKAHVSGAMIMTPRPPATEEVCYRSRRFIEFASPVSFTQTGIRHLLKLFSLSDGKKTFLLAEWDKVVGIVEFADEASYWDEPDLIDRVKRADLPKGPERFFKYLDAGPTVSTGNAVFRIFGAGKGSITFGSRRLIDLREGEFRYDSAVSPVIGARTALRYAAADPRMVDVIQRAIAILRNKRKGGLFFVVPSSEHAANTLGPARVDVTVLRGGEAFRGRHQAAAFHEVADADTLADLAALDGAVVLDTTGQLISVGVVAAPMANEEFESLDFGARHNTAIRLTAQVPEATVVVVSEDGFVSSYRGGKHVDPEFDDLREIMGEPNDEV